MEREVSSVAKLGIMLIAMAALITMIWGTMKIGMAFGYSEYDQASRTVATSESSQLRSICGSENVVMPMAAAYNIIAQESGVISRLTKINARGVQEYTITYSDDAWVVKYAGGGADESYSLIENKLEQDLTGRVSIYVDIMDDKTYKVTLTSVYNG